VIELRALWAVWPVEVQVLSGAWRQPRSGGARVEPGSVPRRLGSTRVDGVALPAEMLREALLGRFRIPSDAVGPPPLGEVPPKPRSVVPDVS
jgi:hypothetical protein